MIRWLEANGYDTSYVAAADVDRSGRDAAAAQGVHVGRARRVLVGEPARERRSRARRRRAPRVLQRQRDLLEDALGSEHRRSSTDHRTLVSYKETHANAQDRPVTAVDGHVARPARRLARDRRRPARERVERHDLHGQLLHVRDAGSGGGRRLALLAQHQRRERDGYEHARRRARSATSGTKTSTTVRVPAGEIDLSSTTVNVPERILDQGSNYAPGTATHSLTLHRVGQRARVRGGDRPVVVGAGRDPRPRRLHARAPRCARPPSTSSPTWACSRAACKPASRRRPPRPTPTPPTATTSTRPRRRHRPGRHRGDHHRHRRRHGRRPGRWRRGLDRRQHVAPRERPRRMELHVHARRRGRAVDPQPRDRRQPEHGCGVGAGHAHGQRRADVRARCGTTTRTPALPAARTTARRSRRHPLHAATSTARSPAFRFYKGAANTGAHTGHLWSADGTLLATPDVHERDRVGLAAGRARRRRSPITAEHAVRRVVLLAGGLLRVRRRLLRGAGCRQRTAARAAQDTGGAPNGVFHVRRASGFPTSSFNGSNYWVDVVARHRPRHRSPPVITARTPAPNASNVAARVHRATCQFDEALDPATVTNATVQLRDAGNALVPAAVTYDAATRTATLTPDAPLTPSTGYTVTVHGGAGGVTDVADNALAADVTWGFTSAPPPADEGPGGPILVVTSTTAPVRPLPRRDPEGRRAERVPRHRHLARHAGDARRLRRRDPRARCR